MPAPTPTDSSDDADQSPGPDSHSSQSSDIVNSGPENNEGPVLPKIIKFTDLARCGEEVWIENEHQIYRLRRTRQGKLILTK